MKIEVAAARQCLKNFDFDTLFREQLGWDQHRIQRKISVDDRDFSLQAVACKRGFVVYTCPSIPDRKSRLKITRQASKYSHEHFIIYTDKSAGQQLWQWQRRESDKSSANREHGFDCRQSGEPLIQKLDKIAVSLEEEEGLAIVDVAGRVQAAFDVDKVTKKFYDGFKKEQAAFQKFISGIAAKADLQWYSSLMLNRLMFVYFIQKKGFLDGDTDYLRNRLQMVQKARGKNAFQSFYQYFLLRLFHDGLGKAPEERQFDPSMEQLLGKVPFLNGGFFELHQLEEQNRGIDIPDKAFVRLFNFFDQYSWHLDERPVRADNEINPDVVGYIFEKYINQKQMGAYYTKEDITEYICKNTIIPFLFNTSEKQCAIAFEPDSALWRLLRDEPERYIYAAVKKGVLDEKHKLIALPEEIEAGIKDVNRREGWNREADDKYALPSETWREHVARRQRFLEIREKLASGEVRQINELITLNLDIWQFARDAIVNAEGPELLRAFWQGLVKISVLDPTCGSGAFLFAALNILETLYSDCLERMERFVAEAEGKPGHPEKYSDFRKILLQVGKHPNQRYFILKSIILNNLFGVDIMDEAVEICKLRLFLKLVAQVEKVEQIEPLPDIDFNIRAGNTLVGFASLDEVRKTQEGTLGYGNEQVQQIEEEAELVQQSFCKFREQQTIYGGKVPCEDKLELRKSLDKLNAKLDQYLAEEYGVHVEKQKEFAAWKNSHKPFHWLVDFYGIIAKGGFDVIVGNPPYVEYSKIRSSYTVNGYCTKPCGNLYAFVLERSFAINSLASFSGMIVPLSIATTKRMRPLQELLIAEQRPTWMSHFDVYPCKLFDEAKQRLTILISANFSAGASIFTTHYNRWWANEREALFSLLKYKYGEFLGEIAVLPKAACNVSVSILNKLSAKLPAVYDVQSVPPSFYVHRIPYNYVKAFNFVPYFWNEVDGEKKSEDYKPYRLKKPDIAESVLAILNSNLFFWWWYTLFEGYHCGKLEVCSFPISIENLSNTNQACLESLSKDLMADLQQNKNRRSCQYKSTGKVVYDEYFPRYSKSIIDEIDRVLACHYGFSDEELDFIINYDIKYRMGGAQSEPD